MEITWFDHFIYRGSYIGNYLFDNFSLLLIHLFVYAKHTTFAISPPNTLEMMLLRSHLFILLNPYLLRISLKVTSQMIVPFRFRNKKTGNILIPLCFTLRSINFLIIFKVKAFCNWVERVLRLFLFRVILAPSNHFSKLQQESKDNLQIDKLISNHARHNYQLTLVIILWWLNFGNQKL